MTGPPIICHIITGSIHLDRRQTVPRLQVAAADIIRTYDLAVPT